MRCSDSLPYKKVMKSFRMKLSVYDVEVVLKNREEHICEDYYIKHPESAHFAC